MNHPLQSNSINAPQCFSHIQSQQLWSELLVSNSMHCCTITMQCNARLSGSSLPPPALMQCQARADWPGRPSMIILTIGRAKSTNLLHTKYTHRDLPGDLVHSSDLAALWSLMISYLMLKDIPLPLNHMSYHSKLNCDGLIPQSLVHRRCDTLMY